MIPGGARKAIGRVFFYLAGGLIVVALALALQTLLFLGVAEASEATVTGYEVVENGAPFVGGGSDLYYPVVEFRTIDGDRIEFQANRGTHRRPYEIGGRVIVLYDPGNPERRRLDNLWGLWGGSFVFVIVAAVFGLVGLAVPYSFMSGRTDDDATD
ncbi:MAG: DUF3592 domain-containing protein, partial [Spirochaetaceae bacterium]